MRAAASDLAIPPILFPAFSAICSVLLHTEERCHIGRKNIDNPIKII